MPGQETNDAEQGNQSQIAPASDLRDAAIKFLDVQVSTYDVLDTKVAGAVGVGSAVLTLAFGLSQLSAESLPNWGERCFFAAVVAYIMLLISAARANRVREISYGPDLPTLAANRTSYKEADFRLWIATEYCEATEANGSLSRRKAYLAGLVGGAFYVEALSLSLAVVTTLWS